MTGKDLKTAMKELGLNGQQVARICGVSRAYISQITADDEADTVLPVTTTNKLRLGFTRFNLQVASMLFDLNGDFKQQSAEGAA